MMPSALGKVDRLAWGRAFISSRVRGVADAENRSKHGFRRFISVPGPRPRDPILPRQEAAGGTIVTA